VAETGNFTVIPPFTGVGQGILEGLLIVGYLSNNSKKHTVVPEYFHILF